MTTDAVRHIGILLFDDVEELDAVGPWEVLAHWTRTYPEDGWSTTTLSRSGEAVTAAKGMVLGSHHSFEDAPALDVLIHPGGMGTRAQLRDPEHLDWVRAQAQRGTLMTSVCTGSLVYAAAGLLADRPATTHWQQLDLLGRLDPTIRVSLHERYVDDGDVITSAGVSAGIDMALHLVERLAGTARARQVQDDIQYHPQPPATADNVQRARAVYAAFSAGDVGAVLDAFAPDVVWTQPGTTRLSGDHHGRDAVAELFLGLAAPGLAVEALEFYAAGDQVIALTRVGFAGEEANELDRFTFADGVITAVEHIGDTQMLARGLGEAS